MMEKMYNSSNEEPLYEIYNVYHLWDRSADMMKYQINRAAINNAWDSISIMMDNIPFEINSGEYIDVFSYVNSIYRVYHMNSPYNRYSSPNRYGVVTTSDIKRIDPNLATSGGSIDITSNVHPVIIEHSYIWWNIQNEDRLSEMIYDKQIPLDKRCAICYGMNRVPTADMVEPY